MIKREKAYVESKYTFGGKEFGQQVCFCARSCSQGMWTNMDFAVMSLGHTCLFCYKEFGRCFFCCMELGLTWLEIWPERSLLRVRGSLAFEHM